MTVDVAIIGGGIVGCACAYYLGQAGLTTAIIEPGQIGGGATAAGMGHIVVMDDSEAQFALTNYSQQLWNQLNLLPSAERLDSGTLWVAADDEEMSFVPAKQKFYLDRGVKAEILDPKQLHEAEPNLRPGLTGGLHIPGDCVVFPMPIADWFTHQANSKIVRSKAIRVDGGTVTMTDGTTLEAGHVVNAAGAHAMELNPELPLRPRRGHLVITERYPDFVQRQIIELGYLKSAHSGGDQPSVAFNVQPRGTGQLLIGSSREFAGFDATINHELLAKMLERSFEYMPALRQISAIRTWIGYRAATESHLPIIERSKENEKLIYAVGHEGLGITTSTATGQLVTDIILGQSSKIDRSHFTLEGAAGTHH